MSDERDDGAQRGRHSRQPDEGRPPERFGRRPESPQGGGPPTQGLRMDRLAPRGGLPGPSQGASPGRRAVPPPAAVPPPPLHPSSSGRAGRQDPEATRAGRPGRGADPNGTGLAGGGATPPPPPPPPPRRPGAGRREPDLLTHHDLRPLPDGPLDEPLDEPSDALTAQPARVFYRAEAAGGPAGRRRAAGNGDGPNRLAKRGLLAAVLLFVLGPLVAFGLGWLFVDVPSAAALNAQRKQVTTLLYSDGTTELGRITPEQGNRIEVQIQDIPYHVRDAVLAAEDRSFYSNPGFDVVGIVRAMWRNITGGSGGGSTITQQFVKVATGDDDSTLVRKYREVVIAAKISQDRSKDQILADYLNTIYLGRGAYGIQAAAQAYFGKNVQDLTVSEGALLAGLIQAPSGGDPAKDLARATSRWNFVLDGMVATGALSAAERATLPFPPTISPEEGRPGAVTDDRAHIIGKVIDELARQGITEDQLATGGGRIVTTIDRPAQDIAREVVTENLDGQPENLRSALVAVDPRTGGVIAYYGGSEGTGFDLAGGPPWSPGSAFKPFTMLAALEQDIGLGSSYPGSAPLTIGGIEFRNSESTSYGALTLQEAMTRSVNTTFVKLAQDVGAANIAEAAHQAGIPTEINGKPTLVDPQTGEQGLGITLGQYYVRPIDMASAYATFAADGMRHEPYFVRNYTDSDGNNRYEHTANPVLAFDPEDEDRNKQLARNVTASLLGVASYSRMPLVGGRPVAAKTGTAQLGETSENSAAWTVGYTPQISTAVWVGDPANAPIENASGQDIMGRMLPGAIWKDFMDAYLEGKPRERFPPYEAIGSAGTAEGVVVEDDQSSSSSTTETISATPSSTSAPPSSSAPSQPGAERDNPCFGVPFPCSPPGGWADQGDYVVDEGDPGGPQGRRE